MNDAQKAGAAGLYPAPQESRLKIAHPAPAIRQDLQMKKNPDRVEGTPGAIFQPMVSTLPNAQ